MLLNITEKVLRKIRYLSSVVRAQSMRVIDILLSGVILKDFSILKAEITTSHRVTNRRFILKYIPENSVGAELGVFTGLFSAILAREPKIASVSFVDPWWEAFGDNYPGWWGAYTDHGRIKTRSAFETAERRIARSGLSGREIVVSTSTDWLAAQPNRSLDWVYIDSTHTYEGTKQELELLDAKLKDNGVIIGDDWWENPDNVNHGVFIAVSEFIRNFDFEVVMCGMWAQWVLRRRPPLDAALAALNNRITDAKAG